MWLTNSPDINHSINTNITSSHIEKKQDWWNHINDTIDRLNSKLALDNLKIELPKTKEEKLQEATKNLYKNKDFKWAIENVFKQWITEHYIKDNVFSIFDNETNDINCFYDKTWKILIFVDHREWSFIDDNNKFLDISLNTFKETWYFMNAEKWDKNIFKIIWEDENWEFILSDLPLDKNSIDYFNALKKMITYHDSTLILIALKHNIKIWEWNINSYINSEAINLKYLLLLKNKNLLEIPDTFEYAIKNMNLTIQDIVTAKEQWDITEEEWREIYNILQKSKLKSLD
jgi:hypothetical protein